MKITFLGLMAIMAAVIVAILVYRHLQRQQQPNPPSQGQQRNPYGLDWQ